MYLTEEKWFEMLRITFEAAQKRAEREIRFYDGERLIEVIDWQGPGWYASHSSQGITYTDKVYGDTRFEAEQQARYRGKGNAKYFGIRPNK